MMNNYDDLDKVKSVLPHAPEFYQKLMIAWLRHRNLEVTATNLKQVYMYLLEKITYSELLNHFHFNVDDDTVEQIL